MYLTKHANRCIVIYETLGGFACVRNPKSKTGFCFDVSRETARNRQQGWPCRSCQGNRHEWSAEEARRAGRKGGQASRGGRGKLPPVDGSPEPKRKKRLPAEE